jgi:hypothetical protein
MKLPPVCLLVVVLGFMVAVADALFVLWFHTAIGPSEVHAGRHEIHVELAEAVSEPPKIAVEPDPEPDQPRLNVQIDHDNHQVIRQDDAGQMVWSTRLNGYLGHVRPPHILADADRVYVTHEHGLTALGGNTGKVLWRSQGPNNGLCLSGNLILATGCDPEWPVSERQGWLTARDVKTGAEVFRVRLPPGYDDPQPIQEVAGLFLVQTLGHGGGLMMDRKGEIRHRFNQEIIAGRLLGQDRVFLTSQDVVCRTPDDKTHWAVPFRNRQGFAGGGLMDVDGGDLVAYLYGQISDSGVQVVRLNPQTGQEVWQTYCSGLGVWHSQYSHKATVLLDRDHLKVTSRGSEGTFVELLDIQTGQSLGRRVVKR